MKERLKITLISSNMFLLPYPVSVDNTKRILLFIELCLEYQPDFILLQEVWINKYAKMLKRRFSEYYCVGEPKIPYNKTGLLMFSKYKPIYSEKRSFHFESSAAFYDMFGQKGYLYSQFDVDGKQIDILNTHLNCPYSKKQDKSRENQIRAVKDIIEADKYSLIVAGDFNGPCDILSEGLPSALTAKTNGKSFSSENPYASRGFHKFTRKFLTIGAEMTDTNLDHVLLFPEGIQGEITATLVKSPLVSDHYPLHAEIGLF